MRLVGFLFGIVGVLVTAPVSADWPAPNRADFTGECTLCHDTTSGGCGTEPDQCLNTFGLAFRANGMAWTRWLAYQDADGDGWLNGQELGDPNGDGTADYGAVSHPGNNAAGGLPNTPPGGTLPVNMCNYDDCSPRANCSTTGSYGYTCSCQQGWTTGSAYEYRFQSSPGPAATCGNVNECNGDNCVPNGTCVDTSPGAHCNCNTDYVQVGTWQAGTLECIAACSQASVDCVSESVCLPDDTSPFFACDCWDGFTGNGRSSGSGCSNIDECASGTPCGPGQASCTDLVPTSNLAPNYSCTCVAGYRAVTETCEDIFECDELDPCNPADGGGIVEGECANDRPPAPANAWTCNCLAPGFESTGGTQPTCVDVDECARGTSLCSSNATCANTYGDYDCTCNTGYRGDGFNCVDIDECAEGLDDCDPNATCTNTDGRYRCDCNEHWTGSGTACVDVNECANGTHGCSSSEVCVDQLGAPNLCECAPGYTREAADGPCVVVCGDGARGQGEACDDGDLEAGDGCDERCDIEEGWACIEDATLTSTCSETCGDGLIDVAAGEECDDGAANSDTEPDACRTSCRRAACGDGVADADEECDEGDGNSDDAVDGCRTSCHQPYCGDGVIDTGEVCDHGGGVPGASAAEACTALCSPDAGIDPTDPPALVGGACAVRAGRTDAPWALALAALALVRRPRRRR